MRKAVMVEGALKPARGWTVFARAERNENNELSIDGGHDGLVHAVSKASLGLVRDVPLTAHVSAGIGALYAINRVGRDLQAAYGGDPDGHMVFARLRIE